MLEHMQETFKRIIKRIMIKHGKRHTLVSLIDCGKDHIVEIIQNNMQKCGLVYTREFILDNMQAIILSTMQATMLVNLQVRLQDTMQLTIQKHMLETIQKDIQAHIIKTT